MSHPPHPAHTTNSVSLHHPLESSSNVNTDYHIRVNAEFELEQISEMERVIQSLRERIDKKQQHVNNYLVMKQHGAKTLFHQQIERLLAIAQQHDFVDALFRRWVLVQFTQSHIPNLLPQYEEEFKSFDTMLESSAYRKEQATRTSDRLNTLVSNTILCTSSRHHETEPALSSSHVGDDNEVPPAKRPRIAPPPPTTTCVTSSTSSSSPSSSSSSSSSSLSSSSSSSSITTPSQSTIFAITVRLGDGVCNSHSAVSSKGNHYIFQGDYNVNPNISLRENIQNIWSSTFSSNIIQFPEPVVPPERLKFKLYTESDEYDKLLHQVTDVNQLMANATYMLCLDTDRNISRNVGLFVHLDDHHSSDTPIQPLSSFKFAFVRIDIKDKHIIASTIKSIFNIPEASAITMIKTNSSNLAIGSSKRYIRVVRSPYTKSKTRNDTAQQAHEILHSLSTSS